MTAEPDRTTLETSPVILERVEIRTTPFPYVVVREVFDRALADALLAWLETEAAWQLHRSDFFEQCECDVIAARLPPPCAPVTDPALLSELRARIGGFFETDLAERTRVIAHRLTPGQGIGIHNDAPRDGSETHRFVVHLGRQFEDRQGGHLVFFNSRDTDDIHRIFRPLHNSGVGFAASRISHHAVSTVLDGERYTIVFSFWPADEGTRSKPAVSAEVRYRGEELGSGPTGSAESDGLEGLRGLLAQAGAWDVHHSDGKLAEHLEGTYALLKRWGCPADLCLAGLFHSIYGTEEFLPGTEGRITREAVRHALGPDAERLVYLFSVCRRESLYAHVPPPAHCQLESHQDASSIPVSAEEVGQLLTLDLANSLEQLPRVEVSETRRAAERAIYERGAALLPERALDDMRVLYGP